MDAFVAAVFETGKEARKCAVGSGLAVVTYKPLKVVGRQCGGVVQVGNLTTDVSFWAPPENMTQQNNPRPVYTINAASGEPSELAQKKLWLHCGVRGGSDATSQQEATIWTSSRHVLSTAGAADLTGQLVGAFASAAIVQSRLNASGGSNGTYYTTLMDAATLLYETVSSLVARACGT